MGGAITRAVEDQYQLGMRSLAAHVADLDAAVEVLEARCALRPGELAPAVGVGGAGRGGGSRRARGYGSPAERFAKTRRLGVLRGRLGAAERALVAGHPSITAGGKRLWRTRNHLEVAHMTEQEWRQRWEAARMFLTADGESGKAGGNETIRVDARGQLRIKVPADLISALGSHLVIVAPVGFSHRGQQWAARVAARAAVRYDISYDPGRSRWYLDASWKTTPEPVSELDELRAGPILGVDLNADHLACCVLDGAGNPIGAPMSIEVATAGLAASRRDGRVRAAISRLLDLAQQHHRSAIAVENLDFADARATGRETLGRGRRGKRLRRTVAGIPTARFRARLLGMSDRRGIAVIGVDPAYTSRWGAQHWEKPLQQQSSDPVTRHHGAAAAIGRHGLGLAIRRRPAGPRTRQRTRVGTPPARPERQPNAQHGGAVVPAHPHHHQGRGSTGEHPPPAAKTGRAAQDTLLRTNQERWVDLVRIGSASMQCASVSRLLALALCVLLAAGCGRIGGQPPKAAVSPQHTDPAVVQTATGAVRGVVAPDHRLFAGIPYAAPPVGPLRWQPPAPAAPWQGVRDATHAGPRCLQDPGGDLELGRHTDEDCLTLNVWTPPTNAEHRPVMVWIHGGSFINGSGAIYDSRWLASRGDIIVVTINYRLGALGFLAHPALGPPGAVGNYGLADQQAALRWVRDNVAAFGGDPDKVTIAGESAGAVSVCDHLVAPASAGLFRAAIIQSGPCQAQVALPEAEKVSLDYAAQVGCGQPESAASCLRALPADKLRTPVWYYHVGRDQLSGPVTGTTLLPLDPIAGFARGRAARVPVLIAPTATNSDCSPRCSICGATSTPRPSIRICSATPSARTPAQSKRITR